MSVMSCVWAVSSAGWRPWKNVSENSSCSPLEADPPDCSLWNKEFQLPEPYWLAGGGGYTGLSVSRSGPIQALILHMHAMLQSLGGRVCSHSLLALWNMRGTPSLSSSSLILGPPHAPTSFISPSLPWLNNRHCEWGPRPWSSPITWSWRGWTRCHFRPLGVCLVKGSFVRYKCIVIITWVHRRPV